MQDLQKYKVIRESNAEIIVAGSVIAITRSGGYIAEKLCKLFIYVEECMFDTAITNRIYWTDLYGLTHKIENETLRLRKNKLRKTRIRKFLDYLLEIESNFLKPLDENRFSHLYSITSTQDEVLNEADIIIDRTKQFYGDEG